MNSFIKYLAEQFGIRMLEKFAKTIRKHFNSILNHYVFPISIGILEGTNNKDPQQTNI
jgi:transposase